ncbi:NUDIX hydrolase [Acidobacteriota bacterium]
MELNPSWIYNQSGVIPFRFHQKELEILLITSRRKKRWVIPKGIIEGALSPKESATKEAYEEAGVSGTVHSRMVGQYQYKKWGGICTVKVYLLEVKEIMDDWPESFFRDREWVNISEAQKRIEEEDLRKIIASLPELVLRARAGK